jgi:cytochrome c553
MDERRSRGRSAARSVAAGSLAVLALAAHPVSGQPPNGDARLAPCLACHGEAGRSTLPLTPSLGGQPSFFSITQLFLFRQGRRDNAPMIEIAKSLSDTDLRWFGDAIAKLPPPPPPDEGLDSARYARGAALSPQHRCNICHSADLAGQQQVPRLANQREDYLLKAMREFKSGQRKGYGGAMSVELKPIDDEGLSDLAHYLAHFRPAPAGR